MDGDGLRGCAICGNDTTGRLCLLCAEQQQIDRADPPLILPLWLQDVTAEMLDNMARANLEQQGEYAGLLLRLEETPFDQRWQSWRDQQAEAMAALDILQEDFELLWAARPNGGYDAADGAAAAAGGAL